MPRVLFATKTAALAYAVSAVGLVSQFWPEAGAWMAANSLLVSLGLSGLMLLVRKVTKGSVVLFPE